MSMIQQEHFETFVYGILPEFAEICWNSKSRRIRTHPDASGIGTSSAEICIWPIDPLLASSCARPAGRSRLPVPGERAGAPLRASQRPPARELLIALPVAEVRGEALHLSWI